MVRDTHAIKTHRFCSLQAFVCLEKMRSTKSIFNWYQLQRDLFREVIREYILHNLPDTSAFWHVSRNDSDRYADYYQPIDN